MMSLRFEAGTNRRRIFMTLDEHALLAGRPETFHFSGVISGEHHASVEPLHGAGARRLVGDVASAIGTAKPMRMASSLIAVLADDLRRGCLHGRPRVTEVDRRVGLDEVHGNSGVPPKYV